MEVKEPVDLTIESLERFLPLAFPREFELSSSRSSYYALITDQVITVVTNRGEFDFDVYDLLELLAEVLFLGETKPSLYKQDHALVSYKLPIVLWLIYISGDQAIDLPYKKLKVALESNIECKQGEDLKEVVRTLQRIQPSQTNYSNDLRAKEEFIYPKKLYSKMAEGGDLEELSKNQQQTEGEYSKVDIQYATLREKSSEKELFNSNKVTNLNYGRAELSIPVNHVDGKVERPSLFSKALQIFGVNTEDGSKHIVIKNVEDLDKSSFLSELNSTESALIFIHGYNVSFKDALYQSAQLKFDLAYAGKFILFSWPSLGNLRGYVGDKERAVSAGSQLAELIENVSNTEVKNVYILAHSMGTYCLSEAIKYLNKENSNSKLRIALAAPDIDSQDFKSQYADKYLKNSNGVSIYACKKDKALFFSRFVNSSDRLGYSKPITIVNGIDTIDASPLTSKLTDKVKLNHSYIFQHSYLITDLHNFFFNKKAAEDRRLKAIPSRENPLYWELHNC